MSTPDLKPLVCAALLGCTMTVTVLAYAAEGTPGLGTPVTQDQLAEIDLIVLPSGEGLPAGAGTAAQGQAVYEQQCAVCHGAQGEGTQGVPALAGGSLTGTPVLMTAGSYWPFASTLYDYIRRAMPPTAPKSLSDTEVYQVVAYVLNLNGIVARDFVLDAGSLPQVQMPNRDGFIDRSQAQ